MSSWSSLALDVDARGVMASVEERLNVGLIATFDLSCAGAKENLAEVLHRQDLAAFDYVPVLNSNGDVVGLLDKGGVEANDGRQVEEGMHPLAGNLLISAQAGILSYIEDADNNPCRLVLRGSRVDGIVTLADLQKLPVRSAIFLVITHMELLMAAWLRQKADHSSEERILAKLSEKRREKLEQEWEGLQQNNLAIDRISATQFCDKRDLLIKLGFPVSTKKSAESELKRVEGLRDTVAHAGDYGLTVESASNTVGNVKLTRRWIDDLEESLYGPPSVR